MEIRYTLTTSEFREGYLIMLRNSTWRYRYQRRLFTWLGPLIGTIVAVTGILLLLLIGREAVPMSVAAFFLTLLAFSAPVRLRSSIGKQFRLAGLDQEISMSIGSEGLLIRRVDRDTQTHFGWSAIEKAVEADSLITLLPSRVQFIPIPKRAMTSMQADELRGLIAANVGQQVGAPVR